jgi:hypothetical protein
LETTLLGEPLPSAQTPGREIPDNAGLLPVADIGHSGRDKLSASIIENRLNY